MVFVVKDIVVIFRKIKNILILISFKRQDYQCLPHQTQVLIVFSRSALTGYNKNQNLDIVVVGHP